jgi:hypothetical protein
MFDMFKVIRKKPKTTAEEKLEQVANLLFPPCGKERLDNGDLVQIDYSIDTNLDAVLTDLREGYNDPVSQKTVDLCIQRLIEVRKILEAYGELDPEAKYVIVDDLSRKEEDLDEKVQAADRER